jgi:ABC-type transport system involved in multi-copper enzyme maturation permease subunit
MSTDAVQSPLRKKSRFRIEINPIVVKEVRSRMRGGRAFATLTVVLIFLAAFSFSIYAMVQVAGRNSYTPLSPMVGQTLFAGLALLELLMVSAVAPSVTAGAISSEREKLTYDMLLATPLSPGRILWGKLVSSLSFVVLLVFAAIPITSLVFIFGGVSARDMLKGWLVILVSAIMFSVVGLFMSCLFGRTGRATAFTYLVVLLLLLGPIFGAVGVGVMRQTDPPGWMLFASPISALFSAMQPSVSISNISNTFWVIGSFYWIAGTYYWDPVSIPRPIYHYSLVFYGGLTLFLYLLSTRLVKPTRRWRIRWAELLVGLALLLGFFALVGLAYMVTTNQYENFTPAVETTVAPVATEQAPVNENEQAPPVPDGALEVTVVPSQTPSPTPLASATPIP